MYLLNILKEIKDENLTRGALEQYEQKLSGLYAEMMIEIGALKKERPLFFLERTKPDVSDVSIRRMWDAIPDGQRLIEQEANVKAVSKMLGSIKSRIYQTANY